MAELKPCPFCGCTKLKIERKSRLAGWNGLDMRVEMHTYSVRCNTCHARGGAVGGRVMNDPWTRCAQLPNWATTDKALEAKAIEAWNRRAGEEDKHVTDLDKFPTIDAVPAVRCRECKHCDPENYHCDHPMSTAAPFRRKPDDFCSYGERKEDAD